MSDVHYTIIFVCFFLLLGLSAPLINDEFGSDLVVNEAGVLEPDETPGIASAWEIFFNLLLLPFWTFGVPWWVSLWILLPMRLIFIFTIGRNLWIGGGG